MLSTSSEGLYQPGINLWLVNVASWWIFPDFFLNWSVVHHPTCWAYALGIFIFRRCIVWHFQYFIACLSIVSIQDSSDIWRFCSDSTSLGFLARSFGKSLVFPGFHSMDYSSWFSGGSAYHWYYCFMYQCLPLVSLLCAFLGTPWHTHAL